MPTFRTGDAVRVRPGVVDPDFPDVPFGGWAGNVVEIQKGRPLSYLIQLSEQTLKSIHPVYLKRCERDGLEADQVWMLEGDLEPNNGEPVEIEQPSKIVTRPLNINDQDDRIRSVFGLTSDDPLPEVSDELLRTYYQYLIKNLSFPFEAKFTGGHTFSRPDPRTVTVLGLFNPEEVPSEHYGLICKATEGRRRIDVPLTDIEVARKNPNKQLVEDFSSWFVNQ